MYTPSDYVVDFFLYLFLGRKHSNEQQCVHMKHPDFIPVVVNRSSLSECEKSQTRLLVVSDTHEKHYGLGKLPRSDIFIHCGDIFMIGRKFSVGAALKKVSCFNTWLGQVDATHRLVIAGNHDQIFERIGKLESQRWLSNSIYLENDSLTLNKINIWATPLSEEKVRSKNTAFQSKEFLTSTMDQIPKDRGVDVLITHGECTLLEEKITHTIHLWGHKHNSYGVKHRRDNSKQPGLVSICATIMDGRFYKYILC